MVKGLFIYLCMCGQMIIWWKNILRKKNFLLCGSVSFLKVLHRLMGFPDGSVVKNPPVNVGDLGSVRGMGRSPGEGDDNPLQCSCLGNLMDRGAWQTPSHHITNVSDMT